jgi:hypothetical protein
MAHIYLLFEFGGDEEKAQQARHKLEAWKQAFRLDKKLLYKLERTGDEAPSVEETKPETAEKAPAKAEKGKGKGAKKEARKEAAPAKAEAAPANPNQDIKLLIRLAFSGHEKLTEQRWVQRIAIEELFKEASPKMVKVGDEAFEATEKRFEELV